MSNPTANSEAKPADLVAWTEGRALIATGSPFDPVPWRDREIVIGQGNNAFVFPGVGLGVLVSQASEVTDAMFAAASRVLADEVDDGALASGSLFPRLRDIRRVTRRIAEAVVWEARDSGLGRDLADTDIPGVVRAAMWDPAYVPLDVAAIEEGRLADAWAI
jgi:malate dehydrogenase (oxaloacetate-decarboxylating)